MKSTVNQIRARFDQDVERFANLETGQTAAMDSALCMDLVTRAAAGVTPQAQVVLDIGCGAGNYTLKLLQHLPDLEVRLVDLSLPMLERAAARIRTQTRGTVSAWQGDIRSAALPPSGCDIILAAMVFHHLRTDAEWEAVFAACYTALRPGGSFWIVDMVRHDTPAVQNLQWARYGEYLTGLGGDEYRRRVFDYIEQEDTPRPLLYQTHLLRQVGFHSVEILHQRSLFAAFGALK